jgi:tRNA(Ile)-lysidine synthase
LLAADWTARVGRRLLILTVDHRLQAQSRAWTDHCAVLARRLGADFRALAWEGAKPATGLPAAARAARHALLAAGARDAGARVILLGHTADDVLEAAAMRAAGSTTPDPQPWSPSPAWPEGRGLFHLRPLLDQRRAAIRDWLAARGETWIDDPANIDPRSIRAQARAAMTAEAPAAAVRPSPPPPPFEVDGAGVVAFHQAADSDIATFIGRAAVCAGGGTRPPSRVHLERLSARLARGERFTASLAGAAIVADGDQVLVMREPGEARRGGLVPIHAEAGETVVWDGRFEITAGVAPLTVRAVAGQASSLPEGEREALRAWPSRARQAAPLIVATSGQGSILPPSDGVVRCLVGERLRAATGSVAREPD